MVVVYYWTSLLSLLLPPLPAAFDTLQRPAPFNTPLLLLLLLLLLLHLYTRPRALTASAETSLVGFTCMGCMPVVLVVTSSAAAEGWV